MRFVLIDESLMRSGYWVSVAGIDLQQFEKNPIMYFMHMRPGDYSNRASDMVHAIGTWADVRKEEINGVLAITGEAIFDEKDEFALTIKNKVESGVYKMASAGLQRVEWSEDINLFKQGQTYATLTKSIMLEASIVDRGANDNAIKLFDETNNEIKLSDLQIINLTQMKNETINLEDIRTILVLGAEASQAVAIEAIKGLKVENEALKVQIVELKAKETDLIKLRDEITAAAKAAFNVKLESPTLKLSDVNKKIYLEMYEKSPELAEQALKLAQPYKSLSSVPEGNQSNDLTFSDYQKQNPKVLEKMKTENPEKFNELFKAEFGKDYKF